LRTIILIGFFFSFSSFYAQNKTSAPVSTTSEMRYSYEINSSKLELIQSSPRKHSFINLAGQAVVGTGLAVVFFVPTAAASFSIGWNNNLDPPIGATLEVLTISSYFIGAAVGVHWVAKAQNKELSFWKTVGYSFIGGSVGLGLLAILSTQYTTIPGVGGTIAALCPVIGSMIYASFVSDWPQEVPKVSLYKKSISHKDLIEQTQIFNLELVRIKL